VRVLRCFVKYVTKVLVDAVCVSMLTDTVGDECAE
jgi:hypothetical protein